ncbi:amidase [Fusarium circinatum]|uniref:Amidase n=1 Tax=Fusarium circinatum TaxID=48490 RepID=A0A8H5XEE1_FUSCI|nr:amidase [Fusarium circinatum]
MPIEPPSGDGPVLTDNSHSQCSHSSSSYDTTFLPSSVAVLPSGSFYFDYSEQVGTFVGSLGVLIDHLTVILLTQSVAYLSVQELGDILHRFHQIDDVWDSHFLSFVVFTHRGTVNPIKPRLPEGLADRLQSLGTSCLGPLVDQSKLELDALTEGPYFATATGLLPVRKLFPDTPAAFAASLVQSQYQTHEKPLNDLKIGIKENIDIACATTLASSLAYGKLLLQEIEPGHMFTVEDGRELEIYDKAVEALEKVLGVTRCNVDFHQERKRSRSNSEAFTEYSKETLYYYIVCNMTEQHFSTLQAKRHEFQAFIEGIFGNNIIITTSFKFGEPDRRDEYRPEHLWLAGQPEIVLPMSQREESLGFIAFPIGSPGMDMQIADITDKLLTELGIPQAVLTGRSPFDME